MGEGQYRVWCENRDDAAGSVSTQAARAGLESVAVAIADMLARDGWCDAASVVDTYTPHDDGDGLQVYETEAG